jgi:hypothetical protein
MKSVYTTTDPIEAEVLRALLRDAGIESTLENGGGADFAIGMSTSAVPLGIGVVDEDAQEASDILARHFGRRAPEGPADPEAPEPLSEEESAAFEEKVRRGNRRWARWLVYVYFLPGAVFLIVLVVTGHFEGALMTAAGLASLLAVGWFVNLLLEPAA